MSKQPIIKLENISAAYDKKVVLHDVNLTVYQRDFLGIIGPNGGGKTTMIKVILGLMKFFGKVKFFHNGKETDHLMMGYLPQYNSIDRKFPVSVEEVILSGLSARKALTSRFTAQHKKKVSEVITRMGLEGLAKRSIGQLSGGQLQRALLGRAIVSDPQVVILDEPSTYIDKQFEARLYELLEEINKECAIILVSHDIGTVLQNVKSIACVNETLDYHPDTGITEEWLEKNFHCPIEVLGHGAIPHRILSKHNHEYINLKT
jgi:ABC-type Mn/Zn transport systems, ATPase component